MGEEEIKFIDDKCLAYIPLPEYGEGVYKTQLIMTKEIFQECYKKWIESQEPKIDVLDKIKGYVDHIRNTGMGKKKSLEFIDKFIEGLKAEYEVEE